MRDHRYVDELSIDELERALKIRKRHERLARINKNPVATDPLREPASVKTLTGPQSVNQETTPAYRYSAVFEEAPKKIRRPIKWRWLGNQVLLL
ncbi:MAG: hypothetical protein E4H27_04330, partial [Anaerolineales bacterium]